MVLAIDSATGRSGPVNVLQREVIPCPAVNRPLVAGECPAGAEPADRLQADYFLRLLAQWRGHIDHRIRAYRKAIAGAEAALDTAGAGNLRRLVRTEERDRQIVDAMVESLRRRFPIQVH